MMPHFTLNDFKGVGVRAGARPFSPEIKGPCSRRREVAGPPGASEPISLSAWWRGSTIVNADVFAANLLSDLAN
jgi:hypothetical protein